MNADRTTTRASLSSEELARRRFFEDTEWRRFRRSVRDFIRRRPLGTIGAAIIIVMIVAAAFADLIAPYDPQEGVFTGLPLSPSLDHFLGTDPFGRDVFSRLLFGARTALSVGYVYSHGLALLGNANGVTRQASPNGSFSFDLNLVPPAQQPQFGGSFSTVTVNLPNGKSYVVPEFEGIDGFLDPNFGAINAVDNSGTSIYHGLQVSLRHSSEQFSGALAYTFSKTIDQGTGYYNQFDQRSQRGPSLLDQTHRLVLSGAWSPLVRPLKGFTLAAVANFGSGRPYTAVFDNTTVNFSIVPGQGFNSFRGPGVQDFDFSVARSFRVSERLRLKFKAEAFDLFNHANFQQGVVDNLQYLTSQRGALPIWDVTAVNPHFGKPGAIAPKYGSRSFQFSARFNF